MMIFTYADKIGAGAASALLRSKIVGAYTGNVAHCTFHFSAPGLHVCDKRFGNHPQQKHDAVNQVSCKYAAAPTDLAPTTLIQSNYALIASCVSIIFRLCKDKMLLTRSDFNTTHLASAMV